MKLLLRLWSGLGTRMEQERHWAGLCWGPAKFEYAYKCLCKVCILKYPICTDNVRHVQNKLKKANKMQNMNKICRHVQEICSKYQENSDVSNWIRMNLWNAVASCYFAYICTPYFAQELCPCGSDEKHAGRTLILWSCALPGPWLTSRLLAWHVMIITAAWSSSGMMPFLLRAAGSVGPRHGPRRPQASQSEPVSAVIKVPVTSRLIPSGLTWAASECFKSGPGISSLTLVVSNHFERL